MYGRKSKPCRVYEYGCLPPVSGQEAMMQELFLRNRYWNSLVEIERDYREKCKEILRVPGDEQAETLEEKIKSLRDEVNKEKQKSRGNVVLASLNGQIRELDKELRQLWQKNKIARKEKQKSVRDALDRLDAERKEKQKSARKASGLYWCNYDDIETPYEAARKKAMKEGRQLRFRRFDGTGKLSVRYQQGLPVSDLFNDSSLLLQIDPVPSEAWASPVRAVRRKLSRTKVRIRARSENRSPVWLELPMVFHRPLPEGGEVRGASAVIEKVGGKPRYKLVITVALPGVPEEGCHAASRPSIGIDIGWRLKDCGGIRVAYWHDEEGRNREVLLPENTVSQFLKLHDLRAIRDKHFNEIKAELSAFLEKAPEWLKEKTKYLDKWRSQKRLLELLKHWEHFRGDEEIFSSLEAWRKKEIHLYEWEANLRDQIIRRRREIYRIFAAWVAGNYGQVFIEDFNLAKIQKLPDPEDGAAVSLPPSRMRVIASPGIFREQLENACKREGVSVYRLDAKYTTRECHVCGHEEKWSAAARIIRGCPNCKAEWDQDHNAAILLLRRGLSANEGGFETEKTSSEKSVKVNI